MSLALATKGIISGVGFGSGSGAGGLYPDGYIASTIEVDVDASELSIDIDTSEISVSADVQDIELTIETYEED
jgi:hypothetical protein